LVQQTEDWCSQPKPLSRVSSWLIGDILEKLTRIITLKQAKQKITYFLLLPFYVLLYQGRVFAQITPDSTLGSEGSVVTPGVIINNQAADRIDGGASRGTNLFHSFLDFNLNTGQRVYFASPTGIDNIITRVTGANPSNILGTLGVNGSANLFLINPNGILFGPNARLEVGGSFFASTASSVRFADGTQFSASTVQNTPLLTVSVPLGVQFAATPRPVQVQGSKLEVLPGRTLGLVGGEVMLQGGTVAAPNGRIELGSVAGNSVVNLHSSGNDWQLGYEGTQNFQDIQLSNGAVVSASGEGGGDIQVQARSLRLGEESRLEALTLGSQPGGKIAINASDSVELTGTGTYTRDILLFLAGQIRPSRLRNGLFTLSYGSGEAGNVEINTPSFIARNGAIVATSTVGAGHGGDLTVNAEDNVELTASALITGSGLGNSGDSGDLTVNTGRLRVQDYGVLGTSTLGRGRGGDIRVNASQSVELIGSNPIEILPGFRFLTGLFSSTPADGDAGDIEVTTPRLSVRDGAAIGASTVGSGKGGNVRVTASQTVEVSGQSPDGLAQSALAATAETGSSGQGGNLSVQTGELILEDEGRLSVRSRGTGHAGNLEVVADSIRLDNQGSIAAATTVAGEGGNIKLQTQSLELRGNSIINAEGGERGNGGNIAIDTDLLLAFENSSITANADQGAGGNITVNARGLFVDQTSKITASSTLGISGVVDINTQINNVPLALLPLEDQFVTQEQVIADSCLGRRTAKGGSFTVTGAGGLPSTPYGAFTTPYPITDLQPISGETTADRRASKAAAEELPQSSSVLQEAQGWYVRTDGRVVLGTIGQLQALAKAEDLVCVESRD
jgi:filamentous hemagglutinin family protein